MSDPTEVRPHVWESLVSMLRVYAHAAGLNGGTYEVTGGMNEAIVRHEDSALSLHFDPDSGAGSWSVAHPEREECGVFRIEEDGALTFPAGPKEIDQAAIDWIGYLGRGNAIKDETTGAFAPVVTP